MKKIDYYEWLIRKAKKSSFARFEANRRVVYLKNISNFALASLSVSIIGLNLLVFLNDDPYFSKFITILTVILSAFTLALSLLINYQSYDLRENEFLKSAKELNQFTDYLIAKRNRADRYTEEQMNEDANKYYEILNSCKYNHRPIDDYMAFSKDSYVEVMNKITEEKHTKINATHKIIIWLRSYVFDVSLLFILCILFSYSLLLFVYFHYIN